ncbi:MAG TPA: hypothetical protein DCS97_06550 [Planctomycetes bacterium]|nr:hypothetical protein [Planctomycetota bacterium]
MNERITESTAIDPEDRERVMMHLRDTQRLVPAVVAGTVACLIAASVWAAIVVFANSQNGWIAIGVGWLVGIAVRFAGRGFEVRFAALGAALALLGVVVGKTLGILGLISRSEGIPFWDLLGQLPPDAIPELVRSSFKPMDLLFYGFAVWMGWKYSRRELSDDEVTTTLRTMKSER